MISFLQSWLSPPIFERDEEKSRKARLLNVILLALFGIALFYLLFAPIDPAKWPRRLLIIGPFLVVVLGLWSAMRRGYVRFTGEAVVFALWVILTLAMGFGAGYNNPAYMGYIVVVVCAALLLGQRAGMIWAGISTLTTWLILQVAERGILPPPTTPPTGLAFWTAQTVYILVSAVLLSLALRAIEEAVTRARQELTERERAEEALRASEARLRMVLENLGEGICVQDENWNYTYANPAAHTILGWPAGELVGKNEDHILASSGHAIVKQENLHRQIGQITTYETDILRPNGEIRTLLATGVPRIGSQGELVETFVAFTDITERKHLENELQEERDFVLQVINTMGQGLSVTNENSEYILINPAYASLTGYNFQEMLGKHINEMVVAEDLSILDQARMSRRQGKPTLYEIRLRHKDGQGVPVLVKGVPRMKEGKYVGAIAVVTDLREIHQTQQALRESEERFRRLSNASFEAIVVSDQGRIIDANPQVLEMFGYSMEEIIDKRVIEFVAPESIELVIQNIRLGNEEPYEHMAVRKDGTIFPVEVRAGNIPYQGKTVRVTALRDITIRKQAEDKIRQLNSDLEHRVIERTAQLEFANKELEAFSYSVSHDLRAPLRAINGFSLVLAEEISKTLNEKHRRYLHLIRENVHRMNQLIEDLLGFSRLGRQPLKKQKVNLVTLTRDVLDELQHEFAGRQVDLTIAHLPSCEADPALLRQVFANLLNNAIKYSRTRAVAKIELGWLEQGDDQIYFVRDNGVGFDMNYADNLFGVFQRLHRQEEFEGTGVGLATVQRIIHRHGGRIWAEAEVDKGATFYFTLM